MTKPKFPFAAQRKDFPILDSENYVYLDSAATTHKPAAVVEKISEFYLKEYATVHRGVYRSSQKATAAYEEARKSVAKLLGGADLKEVVFTKGCTEAINLVASSWGNENIKPGDGILVTRMDHHSNFVTWQSLARQRGAKFQIVELNDSFELNLADLKTKLEKFKPKILALPWVSNALGTINPIKEISKLARAQGTKILLDAAQGVAHLRMDKSLRDCVDFICFSSHKLFGPTGVGVLWAKKETLEKMPPYQYGGDMISRVGDLLTDWNDLPWKFEAGTPNIAGVVGFGAAVDYFSKLDLDAVAIYEEELSLWAVAELQKIDGVSILGPTKGARGPAISMSVDGLHPNDLATYLDGEGICARVGHHCTQPLHSSLGLEGSFRVSFAFYTSPDEVEVFLKKFGEAVEFFRKRSKPKKKSSSKLDRSTIIEWVSGIQDPELKIGLVDLGLVYGVNINEASEVTLEMTLTSPGCPVADSIVREMQSRLKLHPQVKDAKVKLVWDPKWDPKEMASEEAKEILGIW